MIDEADSQHGKQLCSLPFWESLSHNSIFPLINVPRPIADLADPVCCPTIRQYFNL